MEINKDRDEKVICYLSKEQKDKLKKYTKESGYTISGLIGKLLNNELNKQNG